MNEKSTLEKYIEYVKTTIDDKGIYPYPGWLMTADNKLSVISLAVQPGQAYTTMFKLAKRENATQMIFGLDRFNKENQGIDMQYRSVFTIISFDIILKNMDVVVMPYNSPDDIGELQYDNKWWLHAVGIEMKQVFENKISMN
jgi:hypothetical protein